MEMKLFVIGDCFVSLLIGFILAQFIHFPWFVAIIIGAVYGGISWILYDRNDDDPWTKAILSFLWPFLIVGSSEYRENFFGSAFR
jgi:hypothetical protein